MAKRRKRDTKEAIVTAAPADRAGALVDALMQLELPFRATLELAYRRDLADAMIAGVAGIEEADVTRQRRRAVAWLATRIGRRQKEVEADLRELSPAEWAGRVEAEEPAPEPQAEAASADPGPQAEAAPAEQEAPPAAPGEEREAEAEGRGGAEGRAFPLPPPAAPDEPRGPSRTVLLVVMAIAAVALVVVIVIAAWGASDDGSGPDGAAGTAASRPGEEGPGRATPGEGDGEPTGAQGAVAMAPAPGAKLVGEVRATVSAKASRPMLTVELTGLPHPAGEYRAWLYDSVIDSIPLGASESGDGRILARLPAGWERYSFVDLSEQAAGETPHSGRSVARIPTADLRP